MQVLRAAGIEEPRALVIVYTARAKLVSITTDLREHYPEVPIFCRALDARHAAELKAAGLLSSLPELGTRKDGSRE